MSADKIFDNLWQIVFIGQTETVGDVADDYLGTLFVTQLVVRVHSSLVLGKESRIQHLADVMIHGPGTYQLAVGADTVGGSGCQVSQL